MMFKKHISSIIIFLSLSTNTQNRILLFSYEEKIMPKLNIELAADRFITQAADYFNNEFKIATGKTLKIERSNALNKNYKYILLKVNPSQKENFCSFKKDKNITIQGSTVQNLYYGISDFFQRYTNLNHYNNSSNIIQTKIEVPEQFKHCSSPSFEYREPYYSANFQPEFRSWNKTNYLELEWGIWGHNLPKILKDYKLPESVYAKVGNKRVKSQFCFTSDSLFSYVSKKVKKIYNSDHALNKYMILPNDNNIVCTCSTCKALGNTYKNASPAVFTFLNKLAKSNKKSNFFTAAYTTVNEIPNFDLEPNTGVFYSTIDIQKGIPIEKTKDFKKFKNDIKKWRQYVDNIYIWDYTVNFDNYFDIYPILKTTQLNLKLYKELGVNGVFLHGSEYNYNSFQNVKATIFGKLLWNPNIDLDKEIANYFSNKYSQKLANLLTNYYTLIENVFLESNKELSIYSGIDNIVKKYLDPKLFFEFYEEFYSHNENHKFDKKYQELATALTFLKLEIMRNYGLGIYGFGTLNKEREIIIKSEVTTLLENLDNFSRSSNLKTYNERKYKIKDYIDDWRKTINKYHKRKNYFYKKKFEVLSNLDEDYTNTKILNDGAFGLKDYNTNWHISSVDDLVLKIDKKGIAKAEKITFSFLQDSKHHIYYPSSIEILDLNFKVIKKIKLKSFINDLGIKEVSIELPKKINDKMLPNAFLIRVKKHITTSKNAMACDEIVFN